MAQRQFEAAVAQWFKGYLSTHPVSATGLGIHDHDHRLPEASRKALEQQADRTRQFRERVEGVDPSSLSPAGRVDREVALYRAALEAFDHEERRLWAQRPSAPETLGSAIYLLLVRDFAPLAERMLAIAARLEAAPRFLSESRSLVTSPVRMWCVAARASADRLEPLLKLVVETARARLDDAPLTARLARAADGVRLAVQSYCHWLDTDCIPRGSNDFTLGTERFDRLLELRRLGMTADEILALGERHLEELTAFRKALARKIDASATVDAVVQHIAADRPDNFSAALGAYRDSVREARQYVIDNDIATVPANETLVIEATPDYLHHLIPFAAYIPPGKFDEQTVGIYLITPPVSDEGWDRHCHAAIGNTTVHEGYPGHHLQLVWASRHPSMIRTLANGAEMAEGWALYSEELMQEHGFRSELGNQLLMVNDLLWRAVRVVLDVKLSTGRISTSEAVNTLCEFTGMARDAAVAEVLRYTLTPGQPLSYLVGKHLLQELREEARRRLGPAFHLREFHDAMLRSGTLPIAIMRQALEVELYNPPV
ncbi:MAG: DUF885 domain-containing protein [Planctomycetota bacterium]